MITINSNPNTEQRKQRSEQRRQSRYRATCPSCSKRIEAGHWVVQIEPAPGKKRPRWKHEDCDNIPATTREVVGVAAQEIERLNNKIDGLDKWMQLELKDVRANQPQRIEIRVADREPVQVDGAAHPSLEEVVELIAASEPVFIPGPSGSGKSHLAEQVAAALELKFASISCSAGMSEAQLLGRAIPRGESGAFEFCGTPFLDCYENGGLFLFDEIDAADPNVLLVVNSALANGFLNVPARHEKPTAKRHPDFRCIAAANTYGRGADRQYCGRNPIDEATLDRFRIGTVPVDYDRDLELRLFTEHAAADSENILQALWGYREAIAANRLERTVSTRFIIAAAKATARGKCLAYIESKLMGGWRQDEIAKVKGGASC